MCAHMQTYARADVDTCAAFVYRRTVSHIKTVCASAPTARKDLYGFHSNHIHYQLLIWNVCPHSACVCLGCAGEQRHRS